MTTILLDPTLRRARIARATVAVLMLATVAVGVRSALDLRTHAHAAPTLPSPRRGSKSAGRRPVFGPRPAAGQRRRQPESLIDASAATDTRAARSASRASAGSSHSPSLSTPKITAFIDPSVVGATASLRAHASQLAATAIAGLLVGDDGAIIDRIDRAVVRTAAESHVPALGLVQNLDETNGAWRPDRVRMLAAHARARTTFAAALVRTCADAHLRGVHLDLEELDDDWRPLIPIARDVAAALHAHGLALSVDIPATLSAGIVRALGEAADDVVVMAYDEHDADDAPGPIASDGFVADTVRAATAILPPERVTAGLAIYGYDWIGDDSADPVSFVDALAAAKEAHVDPRWDRAGNMRFQYVDDEGTHQVWLTDGASAWNQARIAAGAGVHSIALWRLGGEDPGVWSALAHVADDAPPITSVPADARVTNEGDGPFLALALAPENGERTLQVERGRVVSEAWTRPPSPYLVRRAGIVPGQVALTFDDGPDATFTPQILDVLEREHVPATFFVIGAQVASAPELVRRIDRDGYDVGNHTFTHPAIDDVSALRLRTELEGTTQLVASLIGRRPLLYRPPSLADVEPRTVESAAAFARAGALGYLAVDADVDPRDWEPHGTLDESVRRLIDDTLAQSARGGVVLLHDGGGDRTATVRALPYIINGLRARALQFVPLSQLIGKTREDVMPRVASATVAGHVLRVVVGAGGVLRAILIVTLALVIMRALALLVGAIVSARRRRPAAGPLPSVTAVIPAFNEAAVIERTIDSVLESDVPVDIVVVDDGSTDGTADLVARRYRREPRVRLLRQRNGGKAAALRTGLAACRTEVVVALDGDTLFAPTTVRRLIEPLRDPRVGAVAGTAEVGNVENALARWQALEYLTQQELERRAWDAIAAVPIVPGAVGAWRRRAIAAVGGFASDTLAEDADLAMALCRNGWRVVYAPSARARTEVPTTRRALVRQRVRWSFGVLQALWKHRRAVFDRGTGSFGRVVWPTMIVYQVVLPLLLPAAIVSLALAIATGHWRSALVTAALLAAVEVAQLAAAFTLARRSDGKPSWRLWLSSVTSRLYYRPLLLAVSLRSIARIADGVPLGWGKVTRRNTAVAFAAATAAAAAAATTERKRSVA